MNEAEDLPVIRRARQRLQARRGLRGSLHAVRDYQSATGNFKSFGTPLPLWRRGVIEGLSANEVARAYLDTFLRSHDREEWHLLRDHLELTNEAHVPHLAIIPSELASQVAVRHSDELADDAPSLRVLGGSLIVSTQWNGTTTVDVGDITWLQSAIRRADGRLQEYSRRPRLYGLGAEEQAWELVAFRQDFNKMPASAPIVVMSAPADRTVQIFASDAAAGTSRGVAIRLSKQSVRNLMDEQTD